MKFNVNFDIFVMSVLTRQIQNLTKRPLDANVFAVDLMCKLTKLSDLMLPSSGHAIECQYCDESFRNDPELLIAVKSKYNQTEKN